MSIKISELPAATSVGNNDVIPIVQSGTTKKAAASLVKTSISSTINSSSTNTTAAGAKAVYDYSAPISHSTSATTYGVGTESNYGHCKTINNLTTESYVAGESLSAYQGKVLDEAKEDVANKTDTIDENSTSTQYPNAEATYQAISTLEGSLTSQINDLQAENEALRNQIPTYTATGTTINVQDSSNLPIKDFSLLGNASQNGTPTPDSPVPISVVTGDNTLTFTGKNLFGVEDIDTTIGSNGTMIYANNVMTLNGTGNSTSKTLTNKNRIVLKGTYTVSYKIISGSLSDSSSTNASLQIRDMNDNILQRLYFDNTDTSETFTINDLTEIYFRVYPKNTTTFTNYKIQIQLEKGSSVTSFEPYQAQTQLISLGYIELAKIGDYTDRIFKDNGKWWLEKYTRKHICNGGDNENWGINNSGTANWSYRLAISDRAIVSNLGFSNLYPIATIDSTNTRQGISFSNIDATHCQISIRWGTEDTIANFKTFLASNNLIAYRTLSTPTTTEITDTTLIEQLENVLAMNTYKNETNAFSIVASGNQEGELQITYYQDIATLIDELRTAILSL